MRKLKVTWKMCEEELTIPYETRREVLRSMLEQEDALWHVTRTKKEMDNQLAYLLGDNH